MTAVRVRGAARRDLANRLAYRFLTERCTVTALAAAFERQPSGVRRLLAEGGVRSRRLLVGLPDDEVTACLARRFAEGESVQDLRLVTGIDERSIRGRLRRAGVELAKRTSRDDLAVSVPRLVELYGAGAALHELVEVAGASYSTVRRVLLDAGVELRLRGGRRRSRGAGE